MNYNFVGKNLVVSDGMKETTEKKLDRLSRLFPDNTTVTVAFSAVKSDNKVEISIPVNRRLLRAEAVEVDMYAAIDKAVDILDIQLVKYKKRLQDKSRRDASFKNEFNAVFSIDEPIEEVAEETKIRIERMKHFPLKPMDPEEAIMEMEMLGHTFFVFRNSETEDINVVYKRHKGYGLIDPNDPIDEE